MDRHGMTFKITKAAEQEHPSLGSQLGAESGSQHSLTSTYSACSSSTRPGLRPRWPDCVTESYEASIPALPSRTGTGHDHVYRSTKRRWHASADRPRRADEPRRLPGLHRVGARAHPAARRHRHFRQATRSLGADVRGAIQMAGATLPHLPPYSPNFNPFENTCSKLKAFLHKAIARTNDDLWDVICDPLPTVTANDCTNYFTSVGYEPNRSDLALGRLERWRQPQLRKLRPRLRPNKIKSLQ